LPQNPRWRGTELRLRPQPEVAANALPVRVAEVPGNNQQRT
jgi:hypothetical protein